ncbi:polyprenol monophosphomannose synthase, partial [Nocardioides sp.]|uniref:polyprenol monophosphomannose synthase n=1 Tax=Nocardioides sp. TaxID=35761 RepID=UPI001A21E8D2
MTTLQTTRTQPAVRPLADLTVVVPTFNEAGNVEELVARVAAACAGLRAEILFVDDSTDHTPAVVRQVMSRAPIRVRMIHRTGTDRVGGLSGAVTRGLAAAEGAWAVVMDGDLQHPPELVPRLFAAGASEGLDLVVASRYCGDGDAAGLSDSWRRTVSSASTALARAAFPRRVGKQCTDPMTGFFCVRRDAVDLARLRPKGFKILLEILARHDLRVGEVPFTFGQRAHGESKADWRQGVAFLTQLARLRAGRVWSFGLVGLVGLV